MPESVNRQEPSGGKAFHSAETLIDIQRLAAANPGINQDRLARAIAARQRIHNNPNFFKTTRRDEADLKFLQRAESKLTSIEPDYHQGVNSRSESPKYEPSGGNAFKDAGQKVDTDKGKKPGKAWKPQESEVNGPKFPIKGVGKSRVNAFTSRADVMLEQLDKKIQAQEAREQVKAEAEVIRAQKAEENRARAEIRKQQAEAKKLDTLISNIDSGKTDIEKLDDSQIVKLHYHLKDRGAFVPRITKKQIEERYEGIVSRVSEQGVRGGTDSSLEYEEEEVVETTPITKPDAPLIDLSKPEPVMTLGINADPDYKTGTDPLINLGPVSEPKNFATQIVPEYTPVNVLPTVDQMPQIPVVHPDLAPSEPDVRSAENMIRRAQERRAETNAATGEIPPWVQGFLDRRGTTPPLTPSGLTPGQASQLEDQLVNQVNEQSRLDARRTVRRILALAGGVVSACFAAGLGIGALCFGRGETPVLPTPQSPKPTETPVTPTEAPPTAEPTEIPATETFIGAVSTPASDLQVGSTAASEIGPEPIESPKITYPEAVIGSEPTTTVATEIAPQAQTISDARGFWSLDYSKLVSNYREWDQPAPNSVTKHGLMATYWRWIRDINTSYATLAEDEIVSYADLSPEQKRVIDMINGSSDYEDYMTYVRPEINKIMQQMSR